MKTKKVPKKSQSFPKEIKGFTPKEIKGLKSRRLRSLKVLKPKK